ncbi:MAG: hypothetical protein WD358_06335 [Nitriliruptoraceae bacterium]
MSHSTPSPQSLRWHDRVLVWRRLSSQWRPGTVLVGVLLGVALGLLIGRWTAPSTDVVAAQAIESQLLPLVLDADDIWISASGDRPPVATGLVALRRDGDPSVARASGSEWVSDYDSILLRLAGVDVPAAARPVQRQFIAAVTMSRDAVEVLSHAAMVGDEQLVRDLTTEVGRLRQRSEQMTQSARASVSDLRGQRADVGPPNPVTPFWGGSR